MQMKMVRPLILLASFSLVVAAIVLNQEEKPKESLIGGQRTGDYQGKTLTWNFSYGAIKTPDKCELILRIKLKGIEVGPLFRALVCMNIDQVWNNKAVIKNAKTGESLPLVLTIRFDGPHDQEVTVFPKGSTRTRMDTWTVDDIATVQGHEVGHMLGLFDEYSGGVTYKGFVSPDGLMADALGKMYPRYYQPWLDFVGPDWRVYESVHKTEEVDVSKRIMEETRPTH
jgi:hypothetical protein